MIQPQLWLARQQLKAKSAGTRLRAVQKLRAEADPGMSTVFLEALGDPERDVRVEAAGALGELKDANAVRPLIASLRDPAEVVQEAAILALKRIGDSSAIGPLTLALMRGAAVVQWRAANALQSLGWRPGKEDEEIQFAVALGDFEHAATYGAAAVAPLNAALRAGTYEKRVAVVNALAGITDPSVLKPLQNAIKDPDSLVRTAAAHALVRFGKPAVAILLPVLKDRERNVRVAAAASLGRAGDPVAVDALVELLKDKDWEVRAAVLEALGRLGDARAFQPVAAHLDDKDKDVQQSALEAVAHVGDESVIEKLVMTLVDGHAGVRQAAGRALTRLDPNWEQSERVQVLLPQIQAAMKNRDSGVQTAATNLLKRITGRSALEALEIAERAEAERQQNATSFVLQELLRDWDPDLRLAAAESIARLKLAECVGALKASVRDPDQWVRAAARSALDSLASAAG